VAVSIRLQRCGQSHRPVYRIVAADERARRDGRFLEKLGTFHPCESKELEVNVEVAQKWLGRGAKVSGQVKALFTSAGVYKVAEAPAEQA